jgi:hypothetical protein
MHAIIVFDLRLATSAVDAATEEDIGVDNMMVQPRQQQQQQQSHSSNFYEVVDSQFPVAAATDNFSANSNSPRNSPHNSKCSNVNGGDFIGKITTMTDELSARLTTTSSGLANDKMATKWTAEVVAPDHSSALEEENK